MTFLAFFILLVLCQAHAQFHTMEQHSSDENEDYMSKVLGKAVKHLMNQNLNKKEINFVKIILKSILERQIQRQRMADYWLLRQG
jgi:hypothetical protein